MPVIETTPEAVEAIYRRMEQRLALVRRRLGRPLSLAQKLLLGHLDDPERQELGPARAYLQLRPDRVAMQDATAQMALLQFALAGKQVVEVPTSVHCDHLIRAQDGARQDVERALGENREVYDFLRSASARYGIGFWKPGAGIIHQVVLENYAFPGGMMIGTDSHTPNAGGLGMFACGVGGADAVDVMAGFPWEVLHPLRIGVRLSGALAGWTAPKDVILKLCGILTVKGGTNAVLEYFGPGTASISCTGKATITNMGAELGATTSIFPYDERMAAYLRATERAALAQAADGHRELLQADPEVEQDPQAFFDRVVEIDLSTLEPHVVGPHSPDRARPVSALARELAGEGFPPRLHAALIGSCTNSSYEDICRAADVALQAARHGGRSRTPLLVTPGSEQVHRTIRRDGQLAKLEAVGATVLANACGPCIGQWKRADIQKGERNAIISSFNRNFPARNDGNRETLAFIGSPEVVMAYGLAGRLDCNPLADAIEAEDGTPYRLHPPAPAPDVPAQGFQRDDSGYLAPPQDGSQVELVVAPDSERLQLLAPFEPWDGRDFERLPLLLKARGKCTTDHISPAGPWLRFRGHLDRISDNMFSGALNEFAAEPGHTHNALTGEPEQPIQQVARAYKLQGLRWVAVGDQNYGEGSSREHAAMSPRHLGAAAVIARSFARIHESNLKKQGVLPLRFKDPADYERVSDGDRVSITGLGHLAPGRPVSAVLEHSDGSRDTLELAHTLNHDQLEWFRAGSALNVLRRGAQRSGG